MVQAAKNVPRTYSDAAPMPLDTSEGIRAMRVLGGFAPRPSSAPVQRKRLIFGGGYAVKRKTVLDLRGSEASGLGGPVESVV